MLKEEENHDMLENKWMEEYIDINLHELLLSDLNFYKIHPYEYTKEVYPKVIDITSILSSGKSIMGQDHIVIGGLCHMSFHAHLIFLDETEVDEFCCYFKVAGEDDNEIMVNWMNYKNLSKFRVGKWDEWIKKNS